jgi:hypothetical protein
MSLVCVNEGALCMAGSVAIQSGTTYPYAGVSLELNHLTDGTPPAFYPLTGKLGVSYALTGAPPAGSFLIVSPGETCSATGCTGGTAYQASITTASGMVPWAMFKIQTPSDASPQTLTGPPTIGKINLQVSGGTLPTTFNFCITSLAFY